MEAALWLLIITEASSACDLQGFSWQSAQWHDVFAFFLCMPLSLCMLGACCADRLTAMLLRSLPPWRVLFLASIS